MIAPEEAWRRLAATLAPLASERLPRARALDRVLAAPLLAERDAPAHDVAALDGYAMAGDAAAGAELPVAGRVAAGAAPGARCAPGSVLEIWTGAPLPAGADRVVAVEDTEMAGTGRVRLLAAVATGHAVRRAGEIARAGDRLLAAGDRLTPAALALAAAQGARELEVVRAPRVAVLVTGDEVIAAEQAVAPGQLRDSHTDYLLAAGARRGFALTALGRARDDPDELAARLDAALAGADVVLTCGGVSKGGADHTPAVLARLGCVTLFHGVAMQPGKPLLAARRGAALVFGLPGNPGSVMVAFRLFVVPALERLRGGGGGFWSDARALRLSAPLPAGRARDRFVPARRDGGDGALPLAVRGSHDQVTFARAELLLRVRPGDGARAAAATVEGIDFD